MFALYVDMCSKIADVFASTARQNALLLPAPKKEVMFYTSVCLSVRRMRKLWTDFDEISQRSRAWPRDHVIKFWWRYGSPYGSRSPKSEMQIYWIIEKVPSGLRSKQHSQFAMQKSFSNSIMLAFGGGLCFWVLLVISGFNCAQCVF